MTHSCRGVVWSLCSMSSQVDDVDLLREAGCAPACTARQCSEALQCGLHWVSHPHRQQLTWAAKQRPCNDKKNTVWMLNIEASVSFDSNGRLLPLFHSLVGVSTTSQEPQLQTTVTEPGQSSKAALSRMETTLKLSFLGLCLCFVYCTVGCNEQFSDLHCLTWNTDSLVYRLALTIYICSFMMYNSLFIHHEVSGG